MAPKEMEGDNRERRKKAREARDQGKAPSEQAATYGSSKQRRTMERDDPYKEKLESIRRGKQDMLNVRSPKPRPQQRRGRPSS